LSFSGKFQLRPKRNLPQTDPTSTLSSQMPPKKEEKPKKPTTTNLLKKLKHLTPLPSVPGTTHCPKPLPSPPTTRLSLLPSELSSISMEIPPQDLVNPETLEIVQPGLCNSQSLDTSDGRTLKNSQNSRKFFRLPCLRLSVKSLRPVVATFSQRSPRPLITTGLRWPNVSAFGTRPMTMYHVLDHYAEKVQLVQNTHHGSSCLSTHIPQNVLYLLSSMVFTATVCQVCVSESVGTEVVVVVQIPIGHENYPLTRDFA
jgi:hypothetical protein